jgi:hypothetical protein
VFTQPPQSTNGVVQFARHVLPEHFCVDAHWFAQLPQWFTSVVVSKQTVPHRVWLPQSITQVPLSQSCPAAHLFGQVPQ